MPRWRKTPEYWHYNRTSSSCEDSMYPRSDQFLCVRCKNRTFTSWNDFENHHAKHAVDSAIARLPLVKLVRLQLPPGAQSVLINSSNADNITFTEISSNSTPSESSSAASDLVKHDKGPKASVSPESEELLTWPGSCESSSPVNSPVPTPSSSPTTYTTPTTSPTPTNETIPTEKNISDTIALKPQVDSNILDPAFIEKLGEEISFLNQNSAGTAVVSTSAQEDSSYETLPGDIDISGSSKSSVDVQGLPSPSFEELPSVIPLTPETPPTPPTEKDEMPPETQIEKEVPAVNDPTVVEGTANVSRQSESPEKVELPKSKGQLRLVPFESLLSPSFQHVDDEEKKEEAKSLQTSVISHSISKTHAMVAIPEQNLVELNIPTTHSTAAITHAHHQTITEAARHQRSHPSPPLETMGQNVHQSSQRPTQPQQQQPQQQQPQTRVYQFHSVASQGKQLVTSAATTYQPHQQHLHQQPQQQQNMQNQQLHHLQNQQQQHHLQNQQTQQQQQNQHLQQQKQVQQQQLQQQMQQHQQYQQQLHQQSQQQQQALNNMQYQQQPYQQHVNLSVATGQQQNPYNNQYMQQYSNQQRMQYQPPAYPASMRANPATELPRAGFTSATTFPNNANNCVIQTPPVTTAMYFHQQTPAINQMTSSSSSYPLPNNNTLYNSQAHLNNHSLPNYPSSIQHVQLQSPPVQTNRPQPTVSTVQPTVRQQAVNTHPLPAGPQSALLHQLSLPGPSGGPSNHVRPQVGIQAQRPTFVTIRPQPPTNLGPRGSPIISQPLPVSQPVQNRMPTTTASSTTPATSSTAIRATTSNNLGTPTTNATTNRVNATTAQKRPAVVEGGISTSQPPQKVARTREEATAHVQQSGDCEVLIVQKKQAGLPVIQSVAGSSTSSATKSTGQNVQTPSVASLMSNPNITVTPAKNKENSTSSEPIKAVTTASVVNSVTKSARPVTVDLTATRTADQANTASSTQQQPSWKNPLTCQVCNETFSSQSLLKTHLVLHLKRTLQITARPTNSPPIARNTVAPASSTTNSRAVTSGQTVAVVTPTSSGNGHATYSSANKRGPSATVRPITEPESASVNSNQQTKSGAAGPNNETAGTSRTSSPPTVNQSCGSKDATPNADKSTSDDFFIPVVDLKRQDVLTRLESMGINLFIPASSLTSTPDHSKFAIPILSSTALRRAGTTGFPNLCGVINIGNPQEIPSTKKNPI